MYLKKNNLKNKYYHSLKYLSIHLTYTEMLAIK